MSPKNVKPDNPSKADSKKSSKKKGEVKLSDNLNHNGSARKSEPSDTTARILGAIFVVSALVIILVLIIAYGLSKLSYRVDPNLPIPTLNELPKYTKEETIDVSGTVLPGETVALYQDGDLLKYRAETDDDGDFTFEEVELEEEGETEFEAAVIRGGLLKKRSEKSNTVSTIVDWTAPSSKVEVSYDETVSNGKTSIEGKAEENSTVILEDEDGNKYETKADEDGKFKFDDVKLKSGKNVFSIKVKDEAGNEVVSGTEIEITAEGDINGPGASTGPDGTDGTGTDGQQLPESAGELDRAMEFLFGNNIMFVFSILALAVFGASTASVMWHSRKRG